MREETGFVGSCKNDGKGSRGERPGAALASGVDDLGSHDPAREVGSDDDVVGNGVGVNAWERA